MVVTVVEVNILSNDMTILIVVTMDAVVPSRDIRNDNRIASNKNSSMDTASCSDRFPYHGKYLFNVWLGNSTVVWVAR